MIATLSVGGQMDAGDANGSVVLFTDDGPIALRVDGASFRVVHDEGTRCCVSVHLRDEGARTLRDVLDRLLGDRPAPVLAATVQS